MKPFHLLAAAPLLMAAAPDDELRKDTRCLTVMSVLADSKDEAVREAGTMGVLYFLGRLDGRAPGADLETLVASVVPTLSSEETDRLLKECGGLMEARGAEVVAVANKLKARGL